MQCRVIVARGTNGHNVSRRKVAVSFSADGEQDLVSVVRHRVGPKQEAMQCGDNNLCTVEGLTHYDQDLALKFGAFLCARWI